MPNSTGMFKGQGFGKPARTRHPTAMGGVDRVQLPNDPYMPKQKMLADAIRQEKATTPEDRVNQKNKDWLRSVQLEQSSRRRKR